MRIVQEEFHSRLIDSPQLHADGGGVAQASLSPEDVRTLAQWEKGPERIRPAKRFHEIFEKLVDSDPDRPALVTETTVQSYAELDRKANRIAQTLLGCGVVREEPVAVLTECSDDLPATVLGIWKAGAAYLPLVVEQPPERLVHMAEDAEARVLIVLDGHTVPTLLAEAVKTILRPEDWLENAERPEVCGTPEDLAYIIYTSGTTGVPKGVLIQHDSLVNAALMTGETCGFSPEDRVSLVATPGFDASLWELGIGLLHGVAIVPIAHALRDDPWALKRWYKKYGVTVAFHTPSYLRVSQQIPFEGLRILVTGGEAPSHEDARRYADQLDLWNAYGPTEACIFVCAEKLSAHPIADRPLAVGRPLANTRISIRRENGDQASPGEIGEVWLGGMGLARGYLNNPDLTSQSFAETPDGRFYRTGDLGRWTEDGRLELAGRIDDQIKLHGQRVELGEIEAALGSHPAVEDAITLVERAAEETKVLRAFVRLRPEATNPSENEWREYLGGRLPVHMIPASVTPIAAIPLTAAGKTDREALLHLAKDQNEKAAKNPPLGALEIQIASAWRDLLKESASREDNFFALGGNSLLAVTIVHRLSRELDRPIPVRELFAAPTLAGFARRIESLNCVATPVATSSDLATEGQGEFWIAEAAGLDTRTFTIPLLRIVEGEMPSLERWNQTWAALVARHESLRTYFQEDEEGCLRRATIPAQTQTIETATQPDLFTARAFIRQRQGEPFKMGVSPLWRAGLVEVENSGEHLFWMALHHSVGDGQSLGIIVEELGALLRGEQLPSLPCGFGESAQREEEYLAGSDCAADSHYWHNLLLRQPDQAFAEGPLDLPRSLATKPGNHRFEKRLDTSTAQGLKALARQYETSLHAVMLALLAMEAHRRMGREDVIVGATASTRETAAEEQVLGYYVNMLPIPCHLPSDLPFGIALRETQQTLATGLQHARYPFARIYHDFWEMRPQHHNPTRYPIFDLAVTENPEVSLPEALPRLAPLSAPAYELTDASPGQDMVLVHESLADGGLLLQWHVNAAIYSEETARFWFEALCGWAVWLGNDRQRASEPLPRLLPCEAELLAGWEQGAKEDRPSLRAHELFERVLDESADQCNRLAIISQTGITTYGTLEQEANAIAHALLLRGVTPGVVVGVLTERSSNLPAAVLGIWKAGATYLPLAADLPLERLAFMARDAGIMQLIALDGLAVPSALVKDLPPPLRPEEMDDKFRHAHAHRPPRASTGGEVAYILYTSGSTGQPKGTLVGHDAYVNLLLGAGEILGLTRDDRCLMFSSPSFDVSLSDLGLPLAFGAALCPLPREVIDSPNRFRAFLSELNVTVADITPTYLRLFEGAALPSLRVLVTGGEAPFPADVETYARRHPYFNAYGPTENTISSTMGELHPNGQGKFSAGRPLPNTSVHICDPEGNPAPPGVIGELWLGGAGLAQGYVGRPDLTAAALVETALGKRYRTGDLGRWSASGEIEILGRIDDQIKLNGIRIELGEIEAILGSHPSVAQAVALLDGDTGQGKSLWAFVRLTPGEEAPTNELWHSYLAERLPAFMIPSAVIAVPDIPLTHSGKVDKAALKGLLDGHASQDAESLPQEGLEAEIARVWGDLLGGGPIHRNDNFFELGGHSLLAIAVAHRLETALGRPIPARELFVEPSLEGFARRIDQLSNATIPAEVLSNRATEGQREFWIAEKAGLDTSGFNIALTLLASGKIPPAAQWRDAWTALVKRHDALRTGFQEDPDGVLRRFLHPELSSDLEISSWPDVPAALSHIRNLQAEPFVMENSPLWRAGLASAADSAQTVFWLVLHHSVGDGISLSILKEELTLLLRGEALPQQTGHFDQSAGEEESYLAGTASDEDASYWRKTLGSLGNGSPETPKPFDEWPLDFPRPLVRTARNTRGVHSFQIQLEPSIAANLRALAQKNSCSLHALMLTILAHEVRRRTGRPEFLLGTAASTRDSAWEACIVGYYVNMLPVPCQVHASETFEESLRTMQMKLADGLHHARYPFARIYRDFRKDRALAAHPARYPLFDFAVTENPGSPITAKSDEEIFHFNGLSSPPDEAPDYELRLNGPAQDMVLVHEGQPDGGLILHWFVNANLYEKETAQAWVNAIAGWAHFLAEGKHQLGLQLPALLPEEEKQLANWEHGPALPHPAPSFPVLFEQWTRSQPERPAVITEFRMQCYAEINDRSNAITHALLGLGVERGEPVGVLTDRSINLPETALAIWKAGGCFLPLVTDLPSERMAFIARDTGIRTLVILDGHELPSSLAETGCKILRPEDLSDAFVSEHCSPPQLAGGAIQGSDLAYIIYTSGSTGTPKGVLLLHQGLMNFGVGIVTCLEIRSDDKVLLMASPSFDAWISDLVMAWTAGAAVVPVLRSEMDDIDGMKEKFVRLGVTTATLSPSYLRLFEQANLPGLRLLMTMGEPPHRADALHYAARLRYVNGYGPTENTVATSFGFVETNTQRITIGKPLANTSIHLRNSQGEPVPPGAVGMIWLGGMGLAKGYLNRPELTASSFVETPIGRLYRTGDLGRWTANGDLQFLGRDDGQIKLRGHRIELSEIEHRLEAHAGVQQAVAVVETHTDGTQTLWAAVRLHPGAKEPSQMEWHDELSGTLPSYMLPSAVLSVPTIPVNIAGKVDRAELLRIVSEQRTTLACINENELQRTPPRDGAEQQIAQVWAEHFEGRFIARDDNFFELGGDSLRAIATVNQLRRSFDCTINDLYEHPVLADFAAACLHRPEHLRAVIQSAARHWQAYQDGLVAYEAEREATLGPAMREYETRNLLYQQFGPGNRRNYGRVLLTGATGYLGSYFLRELLADPNCQVSALVRGNDHRHARARLGKVLCHYFGLEAGTDLRDHPRLCVLAGDLRRDHLGLSAQGYSRLASTLQAVFHCAANVKHFGHFSEFHADNVAATGRLLKLAAHNAANPADFHLVSTLSVCGKAPENGFRLFTEYDSTPEAMDENYYVRSKQEAERMVVAARQELANACIHRVGNLVFSSEGGPMQFNLAENAFFRQLAAFIRLGVVPDDSHLWLCHVDVVARGIFLLAGSANLINETHHLEHERRDTLAAFVTAAKEVRACSFGAFLERLNEAVDQPEMEAALTGTLENFGLYSDLSPQARARRLEIVSGRTQTLLARLGLVWPSLPVAGQTEMLRQAALFSLGIRNPKESSLPFIPLEPQKKESQEWIPPTLLTPSLTL